MAGNTTEEKTLDEILQKAAKLEADANQKRSEYDEIQRKADKARQELDKAVDAAAAVWNELHEIMSHRFGNDNMSGLKRSKFGTSDTNREMHN